MYAPSRTSTIGACCCNDMPGVLGATWGDAASAAVAGETSKSARPLMLSSVIVVGEAEALVSDSLEICGVSADGGLVGLACCPAVCCWEEGGGRGCCCGSTGGLLGRLCGC